LGLGGAAQPEQGLGRKELSGRALVGALRELAEPLAEIDRVLERAGREGARDASPEPGRGGRSVAQAS